MEFFTSLPFEWAFLSLFLIVMARANSTYWAGRLLVAGGRKTRLRKYLESSGMARAERLVARWGAPAVALCFLTIGIQTAVNAAAGITRMPYLTRYFPAVVAGSVMWALLYASIGLAAVTAVIAAFGGEPMGLLVILAVVLVIVVIYWVRRRRAAPRVSELDEAGSPKG